ncbi:NAD(P)H-binding protein [Bailinhaonella thermotolerans]|uniref:NmrA family transcriptional regulator n=1 Tax=Bailinhaonella thermotolerans TaxID=1070861 RepID=A0A3A4B449_9ACTN|nr:NAD(P)H-binding protein [Bailinhaonella thermotolerans]RJL35340.1 NmrA family transcriptional regulator [Bailinhaonella thermotolerans]
MIIVTGATGSIGRALIEELGGAARAVVRRAEQGEELGCDYVVGDLERPESIPVGPGDRLFLNRGLWPGFVRAHQAVIDRAAAAGVAQVVTVSVRGATPGGLLGFDMHARADAHLKASGVPWSILAPVGYMQNFAGEVDEEGRMFGSYGKGRVGYIDARDVAAVAAALLTRPVGADATYELTGPQAPTHDEVAAELTRALGRPVRYVDLPVAEAAAHLERRGMPAGTARDLAALMAQIGDGRWADTTTTVAGILGRPPRSLREFLARTGAVAG